MKYLFGPVNSRRLGLSQGIDLLPSGMCNFSCVYCELGCINHVTSLRDEFTPTQDIIAEVDELLSQKEKVERLDTFTITATGEPTLHIGIGEIIRHIKNTCQIPVTVLTNGSLLSEQRVRKDLMSADRVVPSFDSVVAQNWRKVNRPANDLVLADIISGIKKFSEEFTNQLWLEVLLVKDMNDGPADLLALKNNLKEIRATKIQLNTVDRPPLESFAHPLSWDELNKITHEIGGNIEIIASCSKMRQHKNFRTFNETEILDLLKRRPCTSADICQALSYEPTNTKLLQKMAKAGQIEKVSLNAKPFWRVKDTNNERRNKREQQENCLKRDKESPS